MQKPSHTVSILTVKANEDVPEALLLKLCSENMSALGVLVRDGNKLDYEKHGTPSSPMEDTVEKTFTMVKTILRGTKKKARMLVFHSFPPEFDEGEIQPWIPIKDSKGNPLLAVALEGDFPGREIDGNSEMYGLMHEYLGGKIEEIYKFAGNNMTKTINMLKADSFGKDLGNTFSHRAEFVFFPTEGDPFALGKNELGVTAPWGTCSNAYGYTEAEVIEPEVKPTSKFASTEEEVKPIKAEIKTDGNGVHHMPPAELEPEHPELVPPALPPQTETDPIKIAAGETAEGHWETPPASVTGKELKKWYRTMNLKSGEMDPDGRQGALPGDWNKRCRVWIKHVAVAKSLDQLSHTALGSNVVKDHGFPVISGADQAKIVDFVKKITADKVIDDPLQMQKEESRLALFSELCLTKGLSEINRWKVSTIEAFCQSSPQGAFLAFVEMRRRIINLEASLAAGNKTLGELTNTEKPTTSEPVVKPSTPLPAEHKPKVSRYA